MADALGRDRKTIARYIDIDGRSPVPERVYEDLRGLCRQRAAELRELIAALRMGG